MMKTAKQKAISIILFVIVSTMLIGILSACDGIGDDTGTPENEQYLLSQDEFDEINIAYSKQWNENLIDSRELMDEYFRGRFGECIVLKRSTITNDYNQYEIAGYEFSYGGEVLVVHDYTLYSLAVAYESGLLSESDIKELSDIINGVK